jgi:hypothetical protein
MRTRISSLRSHWPLGVVLAVLCLLIVLINPLRQAPYQDDWSYTLMVQHLLDTGEYQVDNWAAANPIFHIYWGALFAYLWGFSFASLRISTLVLLAGGLCGMYMLSREHGLSASRAGIVTFVLLVSPLTLLLGFSYMTDVPFLACTVLGLAFYTRAIRLHSYAMAVVGSVFAAAAIMIRSFGVAFLPALAIVWLLTSRKRTTLWLFLTAMALPLLAAGAQVLANAGDPNWAIPVHMRWQVAYLANIERLPAETFWRLAITLEYLALFSIPLIPVAVAEWRQWLMSRTRPGEGSQREWRRWAIWTVVISAIVLALANFVGVRFLEGTETAPGRPPRGWVIPIIGWSLDSIAARPHLAVALTLIVLVGAIFYARAIVLRYAGGSWREIPDHERLLDAATLVLLALQITYFQFFDRYLLPILPFVLIVVARRAGDVMDRFARPTVAVLLAASVAILLYVRNMLSFNQAVWAGGESLVARGVPAQQISATWEWACYHGAFNDFVRAYDGHPPGRDPRDRFLAAGVKILRTAPYSVQSKEDFQAEQRAGGHLELISTVPYRDVMLRERAVYVYKRLP